MPLRFEHRDVTDELEKFKSVMIVSCPVCPPLTMAMDNNKPFIEFFKHGLKTKVFEDYIKSIRESLEQRGVHTDVFVARTPSPMMCIWTKGQSERIRKRAKDFDAVLVLGCHSATQTVKRALRGTDCYVTQGMRELGVTNGTMKIRFPFTIEFEVEPTPKKLKIPKRKIPKAATHVAEPDASKA